MSRNLESDETRTLIFRADASADIGSGHVMRSFALAQAWQSGGGHVIFATNCESPRLVKKLNDEGFEIVRIVSSYPDSSDREIIGSVIEGFPRSWVVVDGYHFDSSYTESIRESGNLVMVVDDNAHRDFYSADVILNQNISASELKYVCSSETKLLLGTRYAMLRQEFLKWDSWKRNTPRQVNKVLITMGGSDTFNLTLTAITAIKQLNSNKLEVRAVVGSSNRHLGLLKKSIQKSAGFELIYDANNMSEQMAWADLAISSAGSTCWELAYLQLPSILIPWANNQLEIAEGLENSGFALNMGWFESVDTDRLNDELISLIPDVTRRSEMSRKGRRIVDGAGCKRIVDVLGIQCK